MKKVLIEKAGSYDQLQIVECDDLKPRSDEVVVSIKGIGVNYADCLVRFGVYESAKRLVGWPITPGFEFSGIVSECGSSVTRWKVGDPVYGVSFFSAYASQVCVKQTQVFKVPEDQDLTTMGGFPVVAFTAFHALEQLVRIYPNSLLLIHSAAGGVGSALVKIGKILGHKTVGVIGSSSKKSYLENLGCDFIVDKSKVDLEIELRKIAPQGFDAVFDANGYPTLKMSYELLKPTGKLVCYGSHSLLPKAGGRINYLSAIQGLLRTPRFNPLDMITANKTVTAFNISFLFGRDDMMEEIDTNLQKWLKEKKISSWPTQFIDFKDCAQAHQLIESGQSTGKIVLTI